MSMVGWIAAGVIVIALGFVSMILMINMHLSRLRRDFVELRSYLISILGGR